MNRHTVVSIALFFLALPSGLLLAQPAVPEPSHLGQAFTLHQRRDDAHVETEEYIPRGESADACSRLLSVQRLRKAASPGDLLSFLLRELATRRGARVTVLQRGERACLYSASIPAAPGMEAEELLGYICEGADKPGVLETLHYSLRPSRIEASVADIQLQYWRRLLEERAKARNAAQPAPDSAGGIDEPGGAPAP